MKAILINTVSKFGSTGSLTYGFYNYLKEKGHHSIFCFGRGDVSKYSDMILVQDKFSLYKHALFSYITGLQGYYSIKSTKKIIRIIEDANPDLVYLFNLHGYYLNHNILLNFLKERKYKVIQVMFDEYSMTGKCTFSFDCRKYEIGCESCPQVSSYPKSLFLDKSAKIFKDKEKLYNGFNNIAFVSVPYVVSKAKSSRLLANKRLVEIDEGIDLDGIFKPRETKRLRNKLNIPINNKIVLSVAPFSNPRKGGIFYLEAAKKLINFKEITFIHVGFDVDKKICPPNFIPINYVHNQKELAEFYSLADLFVLTSFAETIPNTAMQALGCGTPICGFDIDGIPFTASYPFGTYVEPKNVNQLSQRIIESSKKSSYIIESCRNYALSRYRQEDYYSKLLQLGKSDF